MGNWYAVHLPRAERFTSVEDGRLPRGYEDIEKITISHAASEADAIGQTLHRQLQASEAQLAMAQIRDKLGGYKKYSTFIDDVWIKKSDKMNSIGPIAKSEARADFLAYEIARKDGWELPLQEHSNMAYKIMQQHPETRVWLMPVPKRPTNN